MTPIINYRKLKLKKAEELANSISHGVGIALGIAGIVILNVYAALYGNVWHIVTYSIFGVCMILLYIASTLYHGTKRPALKAKLNILDHCAIYLMIAGSYTPLALVGLQGWLGWTIFGIIWFLAILGMIFKIRFYKQKRSLLSTWIYVLMGWLIVIAIAPLTQNMPSLSLWLLLAGSICYTVGAIFFVYTRVPFFHLVFHLFILAGTICHFFSFLYLLPI